MAKEFPIDPTEVAELVEELASKLADLAKSEGKAVKEEKLAKAEDSEVKPEDKAAEEAPASPDASPAPDAPPADASAPPAPAVDAAPPPPADVPAGDPAAAEAPLSVEEIAGMYRNLPPEELEKHKAALAMLAAPPAPAADASASLPPAPPPPAPTGPSADMMMKTEAKIKELEDKLGKALADSEKARKQVDEINTQMVNVLDKVVNAPIQKSENAITWSKRQAVEAPKPVKKELKDMSKDEVRAKIKDVVRTDKLTKSERDLVNDYLLRDDQEALKKLEKYFQ